MPALIPIILKNMQLIKAQKQKKQRKQLKKGKKRRHANQIHPTQTYSLVEACLINVQDLHEDALGYFNLSFGILTFQILNHLNHVRLLRLIVALPYNGYFLQTFLRRLSVLETRLMLTCKIIKEEAERRERQVAQPCLRLLDGQLYFWTFSRNVVAAAHNKNDGSDSALVRDIQD